MDGISTYGGLGGCWKGRELNTDDAFETAVDRVLRRRYSC